MSAQMNRNLGHKLSQQTVFSPEVIGSNRKEAEYETKYISKQQCSKIEPTAPW